MKKLLFLTLILISMKTFAQDYDFVHVATATDGSKVFVKYEDEIYNTKRFWVKMTLPSKTVKNKAGKLIKSGGGYKMLFFKLDCSDKTYSASNGVQYNSSGRVINELNDLYNERVIPGSIMEGVYDFVCYKE